MANKIVSTPQKKRTTPNFRMTKGQIEALKVIAKSRGEYIQDYMDLVFEKLHEIDLMLYREPLKPKKRPKRVLDKEKAEIQKAFNAYNEDLLKK